jgi:4-amino-4-deoxy-L-arabinose transferase-like glycosyltransferase
MSTIILGRLANPAPNTWARALADTGGDDGTKHWAEALAGVIPAEALVAYSAMIAFFTVKGAETGLATSEPAASLKDEGWVWGLTLAILVVIPIVYAGSSGRLFKPWQHILRWVVAMVAFPVWLWLLPLSPWDTLFDLQEYKRAATGIVAAVVVVSSANYIFKRWPLPPPPTRSRGAN